MYDIVSKIVTPRRDRKDVITFNGWDDDWSTDSKQQDVKESNGVILMFYATTHNVNRPTNHYVMNTNILWTIAKYEIKNSISKSDNHKIISTVDATTPIWLSNLQSYNFIVFSLFYTSFYVLSYIYDAELFKM